MTTIIKVDVLFNIPEEWELAEQFKGDHPEFSQMGFGSDCVHFQFNKIVLGKPEQNNAEPRRFYGVFNRGASKGETE